MDKKLQKRIVRVATVLEKLAGTAIEKARASYSKHNKMAEELANQLAEAKASGSSDKALNRLAVRMQKAEEKRQKALSRFLDLTAKDIRENIKNSKKASVKKQADPKNPDITHGSYANDLHALLQADFPKPNNDISWDEVVHAIMKLNNEFYGLHTGYYDKLEKFYKEKSKAN